MSASAPQPTPSDPPDALLDHLSQLRHHARARSRSAWLPLVVFALLTLASTVLYRQPFYILSASGGAGTAMSFPTMPDCPGANGRRRCRLRSGSSWPRCATWAVRCGTTGAPSAAA
jgi:hypothetical protein